MAARYESPISDDGIHHPPIIIDDRKMQRVDGADTMRFSQLAKLNLKVLGLHEDAKSQIRAGYDTVQIRKTIYSAAALDPTHWPTAVLTFSLQIMILLLYSNEPFNFLDIKLSPLLDRKW